MITPLLLSPLDPSALVDGGASTVDGGFAARLLACVDAGIDSGTLTPDAARAQEQEQSGETPMTALVAMLTEVEAPQVPADGETTASADGAQPAEDCAAAPDEDPHAAAAAEPAGTEIATTAAMPAVAPTPESPAAASTTPPSAPAATQPMPADMVGHSSSAVAVGQPLPKPSAAPSTIAASAPAGDQPSRDIAGGQPSPAVTGDRPAATVPTAPPAPVGPDAPEQAANMERTASDGSVAEAAAGGAQPRKGAPTAATVEPPAVAPIRRPAGPSTGRDSATVDPTPDAETTAAPPEPSGLVAETSRGAATATRPEGERPTAQSATVFVDPAAGGESDVAAPATHSAPVAGGTGDTSAPAAPTVARIVELVERLRAEPPPRTIVVDLDQFGVGKLVVSLRGDSVVVEPLDPNARLDPHWQDELGAALDERGWSFDADRRSRREPQHPTAPPASDVPVTGRSTRTSRPADGHLRL